MDITLNSVAAHDLHRRMSDHRSSFECGSNRSVTGDTICYSGEGPISYDGDTQSLTNSVYEFPKENGRSYHGYRAGAYRFPNDLNEIDRLDSQFEILRILFQGHNYFAPLANPQKILDIGTGTGQWAIEMGDEFPDAEVQGTDLSPIQPPLVPENVHFFIDDASDDDWVVPPAHFDYIHTRLLLGAFTDFSEIIRKAFFHLKPGGWMEGQEAMTTPYCDDGTMPPDWPFFEWTSYCDKAAMEAGRPLRIANRMKKWYEQAGFVDVQEKIFKLPLNPWANDPEERSLGKMSEENWLAGLNAFSMAPFTRDLEWTKEEIEVP
ncbi:putative Trans-aconitate 2-methyltransferase [Calycina marina]|uniref:Trans-aconitate 2-methyltransferase n=1 Tax=Calycina marina TaxID=1763456 RepID=A0A9P8CD28_9HELO|nr:putative Trans-aconitate 2-methyltransferase [Calycina marina]